MLSGLSNRQSKKWFILNVKKFRKLSYLQKQIATLTILFRLSEMSSAKETSFAFAAYPRPRLPEKVVGFLRFSACIGLRVCYIEVTRRTGWKSLAPPTRRMTA